jgi:hypothetical protein
MVPGEVPAGVGLEKTGAYPGEFRRARRPGLTWQGQNGKITVYKQAQGDLPSPRRIWQGSALQRISGILAACTACILIERKNRAVIYLIERKRNQGALRPGGLQVPATAREMRKRKGLAPEKGNFPGVCPVHAFLAPAPPHGGSQRRSTALFYQRKRKM